MRLVPLAGSALAVVVLLSAAVAAEPPGDLRGRVVDGTGEPVAAAEVTLRVRHSNARDVFRAEVGSDGRFTVPGVHPGSVLLRARSADGRVGLASARHGVESDAGELVVTVAEPRTLRLRVLDPDGRPLAGAYVHSVDLPGPNGGIELRREAVRSLALGWPESGEDGLVEVGGLPATGAMKVAIAHSDFLRGEPVAVPPDVADPPTVRLARGGRLVVRLRGDGIEVPRDGLEISVFGTVRYLLDEPCAPDADGRCEFTVPHGTWSGLVRGPRIQTLPALFENVAVTPDGPGEVAIDLTPRGVARGRVLDAETGEPVAECLLSAAVHSSGHATDPYGYGAGWHFSAHAVTDADGRYEITPGVGLARLWVRSPGRWAEPERIELDVSREGPADAAPFRLLPPPRLTGTVFDPDGLPVPHAILKPVGEPRYEPSRVADGEGRFEYAVGGFDRPDPAGPGGTLSLRIFDPRRPLEAVLEVPVDLRGPGEALTVRLTPAPIPPPPAPERREPQYVTVSIGQAAPELLGREVLNAAGPIRLADFEGKFVLLDFWTVWCGPCRLQKPEVEAAARLYADRLAVVGVHDASVPPEEVAADVAENGPSFPTVIDTAAADTTRRYGVTGWPMYVLIGPDGRVLMTSGHNGEAMWTDLLGTLRSYLHGPPRGEPAEARRP